MSMVMSLLRQGVIKQHKTHSGKEYGYFLTDTSVIKQHKPPLHQSSPDPLIWPWLPLSPRYLPCLVIVFLSFITIISHHAMFLTSSRHFIFIISSLCHALVIAILSIQFVLSNRNFVRISRVVCPPFTHWLQSVFSCGWFTLSKVKVLVATIDAQWEGMGDVGSARYEPALLPHWPTIKVLSCSN